MKISIITAAWNSAATIEDTLRSILAQTYQDWECIVIDGASSDGTQNILRSYETRFSGRLHWISEPDQGIYDAMNKGIAMATGEVIGMLNSDDLFIDAEVLTDIASAFEDRQIACIHGNLYFVRHDDTNRIVRIWESSPYKPNSFARGWHPAHPTFYVRREYYIRLGGYDIAFPVSADFELMLRFLEKHRLHSHFINRFLVKMRMGGESTGSLRSIYVGNRNVMKAFHKNGIPVSPLYPVFRLAPKVINKIKLKLHLK